MKNVMLDSVHASGKAANISAESFVQQHSSLSTAVKSHDESINGMGAKLLTLEQQVNAIMRVMASQNIQKMSETIKTSQDDLRMYLMQVVNDKNKDCMAWVEREVADVTDSKSGLGARIDAVEEHVLSVMNSKLDEARQMRYELKEQLEKVTEMMEHVPDIAEKNSKAVKILENKMLELKNEFRTFERNAEQENMVQDKQVASLNAEIRSSLEEARDKLNEETKTMTKSLCKHEVVMEDKIKELSEAIEAETADRVAMGKRTPGMITAAANTLKGEFEKKFSSLDHDMDRKVRPFVASLQEVSRKIDEEVVLRQSEDQALAMRIAKEVKDRNQDEARLVTLISTCQESVAKMHKI